VNQHWVASFISMHRSVLGAIRGPWQQTSNHQSDHHTRPFSNH